MRPIGYLAIGAAALTATAFAPGARAQTSATPPAARALLPASVLATLLQNSVHVAGNVDIGVAGVSVGTSTVAGDVAWQNQIEGTFQVSSSSAVVTAALGGSPVNLVFVGKKAAVQVGSGAWKCSGNTNAPPGTSATAKSSTSGSRGTLGKKGKKAKKSSHGSAPGSGSTTGTSTAPMVSALPAFGAPVDLGADTIDGIAVWHVQAKSTAASKTAATLDLYITQSDLTLKRVAISGTSTGAMAASVTATFDLSQYGEPVSVTLPAACAGSGKAVSGVALTWLRVASALAQPRNLLTLVGK